MKTGFAHVPVGTPQHVYIVRKDRGADQISGLVCRWEPNGKTEDKWDYMSLETLYIFFMLKRVPFVKCIS